MHPERIGIGRININMKVMMWNTKNQKIKENPPETNKKPPETKEKPPGTNGNLPN